MKQGIAIAAVAVALSGSLLGAGKGPQIQIMDQRVSMQAEAIPLGRLLRLFDIASGMTSKVPNELANRNVSVQFSGLSVSDAVKKIFEGLPLDYVLIEGRGVVVTSPSQRLTASDQPSAAPFNSAPPPMDAPMVEDAQQPPFYPQPVPAQPAAVGAQPFPGGPPNNPFNSPFNQQQPQQQQAQPAMIQTPFGPIPNPRLNQPAQPTGNVPLTLPGQQLNAPSNSGSDLNFFFNQQPAGDTTSPAQGATPVSPFGQPLMPPQRKP